MNLASIPKQPDEYEPSEADLEMVVEETTGKPVKPENAAAGVASMQQRIAELEALKTKLVGQLDLATGTFAAELDKHLVLVNKDIATARERLAHYESQLGKQN